MKLAKQLTASLAAIALASVSTAATADNVKIAVVVGSTGTYAFVGSPLIKGIELALEDLKAANAFGDHTVDVTYNDNRSDKAEAISLITRMANSEGADIILGPVATSEALATGPVANNLEIPLFTTAQTASVLEAGPWVFKSTEASEALIVPVAEHIASLKPNSCFIVHIRDNDAYVVQAGIFRDTVSKLGIEIAGYESVLAADTDFTALSTKIVAADPDCLFVTSPPEQTANIIIQARQSGLDAETILGSDTGAGARNFIEAGGTAVEGTIFVANFVPTFSETTRDFTERYAAKFNLQPDIWAATGYSMMQIVASAIKNISGDVTRQALRDAMAATKDVPVVVGKGLMTFDEARIPHAGGVVMQVKDGGWAAVE